MKCEEIEVVEDNAITVAVTSLSIQRVRQAVGVLCRAFAEDPILTFYFDEHRRRTIAYRAFFSDIVRASLRTGSAYVALHGDRVVAAAAWQPPDAGPPTAQEELRGRMTELVVRALFPRTAGAVFEGFGELQTRHPKEPHWYLAFVGVDTDLQGKGIGANLLTPVLQQADHTGMLCYLETPFPRTHAFYQRIGFAITGEMQPFKGAPPIWTLLRAPGSAPVD
jgi:GNAT superfamily N-acetyltransferase